MSQPRKPQPHGQRTSEGSRRVAPVLPPVFHSSPRKTIVTAIMASRNASTLKVKSEAPTPYDATVVFGAAVQLPAFDKVDQETWFTVADANFALRKVTESTTKYYYLLSKLDAESLRQVSAFLKQPRGDDPYQEIKDELCHMYKQSLEEKLDAVFALTDLGDERPKKFGKELQRLVADASRDDMLKRVFVRCLPQRIVTAITGSLGGNLDMVIAGADKAWTASASSTMASVSAVTGPPSGGRHGGLHQGCRPTGPQGNTGPQRTQSILCVYHKKFGNTARKCAPGCSRWNKERSRESRVFQVEGALDGEDEQDDTASGNV